MSLYFLQNYSEKYKIVLFNANEKCNKGYKYLKKPAN